MSQGVEWNWILSEIREFKDGFLHSLSGIKHKCKYYKRGSAYRMGQVQSGEVRVKSRIFTPKVGNASKLSINSHDNVRRPYPALVEMPAPT